MLTVEFKASNGPIQYKQFLVYVLFCHDTNVRDDWSVIFVLFQTAKVKAEARIEALRAGGGMYKGVKSELIKHTERTN